MSRKLPLFAAAILLATSAFAQVEQGAITGVVVDATNASIPNAKVTAKNETTGGLATAATTEEGYYKLPYLPAGKYALTVEKEGFSLNRINAVPVLVGQNTTINITLKAGTVHEEVTVTANAAVIEQVSSSLGYVTGTTQILELPINRSPYSLMNLS